MGYILLLRLKMGTRFLAELGWIRSGLLLACLISFFIPLIYYESSRITPVIFILGIALVWNVHIQRRDWHFVQGLGIWVPSLYGIEYLLILLPFICLLIWHGAWFWLAALLTGVFIRIQFPVHTIVAGSTKRRFRFPDWLTYEWTSGLRRQKWILALLMIAGITALPFSLFAGWISLYIITATIASFYQYCEPNEFILLSKLSPARFLQTKILQGISYFTLLTGILWIESIIFYPRFGIYTLLFIAANLVLVGTTVITKYAFFHANLNISLLVSSVFFMASLFLAEPYLLPVLVGLFIWLTVRAYNRLKTEVYVFD